MKIQIQKIPTDEKDDHKCFLCISQFPYSHVAHSVEQVGCYKTHPVQLKQLYKTFQICIEKGATTVQWCGNETRTYKVSSDNKLDGMSDCQLLG